MNRSSARRIATLLWVVVSLLFSQLALAQYLCPIAGDESTAAHAMAMAPGEPCAGMDADPDADQPVLCHQHCANAAQSIEPLKVPTVTLPAVLHVLLVPEFAVNVTADRSAPGSRLDAKPPPTPLFLSTLRLRV